MMFIIGGPTASGKSAVALQLADHLIQQGKKAEILCADSITVYRGFDIGAAKPNHDERSLVPHHLLDLVGPGKNFTAGDFLAHADPIVMRLLDEGKVPIVAGGSGFYLRALLRGMAGGEEDPLRVARIKAHFEGRAAAEGWDILFAELMAKDPGSAGTIHLNDHYRIIRALSAMEMTGEKWSELNKAARASPPRYEAKFFRLRVERDVLKARIEKRTGLMLEAGLIDEVKNLLAFGVSTESKPMLSVGYKDCVEFLRGDFPREQLSEKIVMSTMKLAKSQQTWFKGEELAEWLEPPYFENLLKQI